MNNKIPFLYDPEWHTHEIHYSENHGSRFISNETIKTDSFILPALVFEESDGSHSLRLNDFLLTPNFLNNIELTLRKNIKKVDASLQQLSPIASKFGIESSMVHQFTKQSIAYPEPLVESSNNNTILRRRAFVDLTQDVDDIKRNFRKSYKQFVNKQKNVNIFHGKISSSDFGLFVDKHFELAGRKTKPDICWDILKDFVDNEKAILVQYEDNFLYFFVSSEYSYYAISGSEARSSGVTHALMWEGIKAMKEVGSELLDLGIVYHDKITGPYLSSSEINDFNKIRQIGFFKNGFSNLTRYDFYIEKVW
tara:strand:+ start:190 stop:1113 length:924 start_codon:yes stop_codon:yes gene_type:complete